MYSIRAHRSCTFYERGGMTKHASAATRRETPIVPDGTRVRFGPLHGENRYVEPHGKHTKKPYLPGWGYSSNFAHDRWRRRSA